MVLRTYITIKNFVNGVRSKAREVDALPIKQTLHDRFRLLLAKHEPEVRIELRRWLWQRLYGVLWGGPFTALVYLDGECFCGMSFDIAGNNLRITQIHGVNLNRCRYRPMRRYWERTLVEAAHDLGFRLLLVRAEHTKSWPDATPEIRERLTKRLDDTARMLGLSSTGDHWVWPA